MSRRSEFSAKIRVAAYERAKGRCEGCTAPLLAGRFQYDHDIPDGLGGEATLDNCKVLCSACHGEKTAKEDVPTIARAKRKQRNHIGARPKPRNLLPGSKGSGFRKKLNGEVQWIKE